MASISFGGSSSNVSGYAGYGIRLPGSTSGGTAKTPAAPPAAPKLPDFDPVAAGQMYQGGGGGGDMSWLGGLVGALTGGGSAESAAGAPAAGAPAASAIGGLKTAAGLGNGLFDSGIMEQAAPGAANPALGQRVLPQVSRILSQIPKIY